MMDKNLECEMTKHPREDRLMESQETISTGMFIKPVPHRNKYFQERNTWWKKFDEVKKSIIGDAPCYCKEKWGRYDTSYYGNIPGAQNRLLEEVEAESERCCQYCGKHLPQVWIDRGWVIHLCWWHALCGMCLYLYHRIKQGKY